MQSWKVSSSFQEETSGLNQLARCFFVYRAWRQREARGFGGGSRVSRDDTARPLKQSLEVRTGKRHTCRDLNRSRNERRMFFTMGQRKDGGHKATVSPHCPQLSSQY